MESAVVKARVEPFVSLPFGALFWNYASTSLRVEPSLALFGERFSFAGILNQIFVCLTSYEKSYLSVIAPYGRIVSHDFGTPKLLKKVFEQICSSTYCEYCSLKNDHYQRSDILI